MQQPSSLDMTDTKTITCPSGLVGIIRNMTVAESRIFAGKGKRGGLQLNQLLAACWVRTEDPGPYKFTDDRVQWAHVLQGDRFYVLLQIRTLTYGGEYAFSIPCKNAACEQPIKWELDLEQLPVRALSSAGRETFANGNRFEAPLSGGRTATFGLLIGQDEERLARLRSANDEGMLQILLGLRIWEISGVPSTHKFECINRMSMRQARSLLASFDDADCGVTTNIDIECPHCGYVQGVDLPLDQNFLWPTATPPSSLSSATTNGESASFSCAGNSMAALGST